MEQQTHKNISLHHQAQAIEWQHQRLKGLDVTKMKLKQKQEQISCLEDYIWELHKAIKYANEAQELCGSVGILSAIRFAGNRKNDEYKTLSKILNPDDRDDLK